MVDIVPEKPRKGRGAVSNPTGRYEPQTRHRVDDGWTAEVPDDPEEALPPLRTFVTREAARAVITRNTSPDISFDRSINPYRGCEHGCVYCFARPSHAYMGLSPGLDFESRLFAKVDAPAVLERELRKPGYRCGVIAMGTNTDPYQPIEKDYRIMRGILEVLAAFEHPVSIVTKSALVLRDLDILAPMAAKGLAAVGVSVTTLDRDLARRMEPRAATPPRRLATLKALSDAGVPTTVMAAPMIPALNDGELESILAAAREAGATRAGYVLLRLPLELKELFEQWLATHVPDRAAHVLSLMRQCRGGLLYKSEFGGRMRGEGPYAELLAQRFQAACRRLGFNSRVSGHDGRLDTSRFRPPPRPGDQLSLF
jgi:DNA repair photolyase